MSREQRRFLIAYDISVDKRRTRLSKLLETYGDRIQYSVFVVDCNPARLQRLRREILEVINQTADSVLLCDLGLSDGVEERRFTFLGHRREITPRGPLVF